MGKKLRVYLSGPISGRSYKEAFDFFHSFEDTLRKMGYDVLNPMSAKGPLTNETKLLAEGYNDKPVATPHAIFNRDKWMVSNADVVFCNLYDAKHDVSIGSVMELAWASLLGKHIILVVGDNNIHRHAFVTEAADIIFKTPVDAVEYLKILIQ